VNDDRLTLGLKLGAMKKRHWGPWFLGCAMALVPLGTWIFVHYMVSQRVMIRAEATRELIFLAVSASSASLIALTGTAPTSWSRFWLYMALFLTIFAAVAYGVFLTGEALHAAARFRGAYYASIAIAVFALLVSAIVHYYFSHRS
jgi:hypothetical protein